MYFSTPSLMFASERDSNGGYKRRSVITQLSTAFEFWFALQKKHPGLEVFLTSGKWKSV